MSAYNPFERHATIRTEFGTINFEHPLGPTYVSHRENSKSFFKKFQGFGFSMTELRTCEKENVKWLILIYRNTERGTETPYRVPLKYAYQWGEDYSNYTDIQKVVPLRLMEQLVPETGEWRPTTELS